MFKINISFREKWPCSGNGTIHTIVNHCVYSPFLRVQMPCNHSVPPFYSEKCHSLNSLIQKRNRVGWCIRVRVLLLHRIPSFGRMIFFKKKGIFIKIILFFWDSWHKSASKPDLPFLCRPAFCAFWIREIKVRARCADFVTAQFPSRPFLVDKTKKGNLKKRWRHKKYSNDSPHWEKWGNKLKTKQKKKQKTYQENELHARVHDAHAKQTALITRH